MGNYGTVHPLFGKFTWHTGCIHEPLLAKSFTPGWNAPAGVRSTVWSTISRARSLQMANISGERGFEVQDVLYKASISDLIWRRCEHRVRTWKSVVVVEGREMRFFPSLFAQTLKTSMPR